MPATRTSSRPLAAHIPPPAQSRYFTVPGADDRPVRPADGFLFGLVVQGKSTQTSESYAGALALFFTWCAASGNAVAEAASRRGLFTLWLRHYDPKGRALLPGSQTMRGAARINMVLAAVREFYKHQVLAEALPASCLNALYRVVQSRDLPTEARGEFSGMGRGSVPVTGCRCQTGG